MHIDLQSIVETPAASPGPAPRFDLSNCDREPIHQLGSIQPFGFLIVATSDWRVARMSLNIASFLKVDASVVPGCDMADLLNAEAIHTLRNRLTLMRGQDIVERILGLRLQDAGPSFDVAIHISAGQFIIEAEPSQEIDKTGDSLSVRGLMVRLNGAKLMPAFLREGARHIRAITGFDRVMVYRFDEAGSGEVCAEAVKSGIGSFMGLHYPASDIPAQARALYLRNMFRIIANVNDSPVGIEPQLDDTGKPLDLSMSILRSISPIHIEYLKNMGVEASLSISIIVDGNLWGLFACHHYSPRLPTIERRSTAELFGQMFSSRLESRERQLALDYDRQAREIADRLMASIAEDAALLHEPDWLLDAVANVIPADGIGVWINGRSALSGLAPSQEQFAQIVKALDRTAAGKNFDTNQLATFLPDMARENSFCGLLAIPISRVPRDYVVLFRQEIIRTVRWAGDPHKPVEYGENGPRLTPRKSFEAWSELVRGQSLPFTAAERRVAEIVRATLIEVVLRLSNESDIVRQQASDRQEILIAELNHRVRNILGLISGLVRQSKGAATSIQHFSEQLEGRIQALARAHDQITRDQWTPAPLVALLKAEAEAYLGANADRIVLTGPQTLLSPHSFSTIALVVHELMTNSAKYGSLSAQGTVRVTWLKLENGDLAIAWIERGGPHVKERTRYGFGSTIIARSIPYDLGGKAEVRFDSEGLEAAFTIPAQHVSFPIAVRAAPAAPKIVSIEPLVATSDRKPLRAMRVLLVEDNLIIALDGEDILRELGAIDIITASNVSQAFDAMEFEPFDFAILDVNLGRETSFPIADKLQSQNVPLLFATGYSDINDRFQDYAKADFLQKPYTLESVERAVLRLKARV